MARLVVILVALVLVAGAPSPVYAHADLQQTEPAAGASVPAPPSALRLRFSEPLDLSATRVKVLDEGGARVDSPNLAIGPPNDRLLTVDLGDLSEGVYTVRWWSLSQVDGHRWQGVYRFGVGRTPPAAEGTPPALPSALELAIKWAALVATALALGSLAFRVWALEPTLARLAAAPKTLDRFGRCFVGALLPPPGETSALPLDLVQPAGPEGKVRVHLVLDRVRVGGVGAEVRADDPTGRPLGQTAVSLTATELAPFDGPLDRPPSPTETFAAEQPDGRQVVSFAPFSRPGWWRVLVRTTVHLQGVVEVPFDVLVPDPNRAGLDPPATDPAAARLFADTLD